MSKKDFFLNFLLFLYFGDKSPDTIHLDLTRHCLRDIYRGTLSEYEKWDFLSFCWNTLLVQLPCFLYEAIQIISMMAAILL